MKKLILVTTLLLSSVSVGVYAGGSGMISFAGEIKESTCTVNTYDSTGSGTPTIFLPTVGSSSLASAGDTTGSTQFTIRADNCQTGIEVVPYFETGINVDSASGRYNNDTRSPLNATNVQIEILDANGAPVKVGDSSASLNYEKIDSSGTFDFNYYARYYSTGATTPGSVLVTGIYTLVYK